VRTRRLGRVEHFIKTIRRGEIVKK
jgi:hypothetical protein